MAEDVPARSRPNAVEWVIEILRPPTADDVLIRGEKVHYAEPRHWMMLFRITGEAISAVQLTLWIMFDEPFGLRRILLAWTVVSVGTLVLWLQRQPTNRMVGRSVVVATIAVVTDTGVRGFLVFWMLYFVMRMVRETIMWAWYRRLYVTDRRIMETKGIVNRQVATLPLQRVTDASLAISGLGDYLGYGEFHLETAGQQQALGHLRFLVDPERFNDVVMGLATNPKTFDAGH